MLHLDSRWIVTGKTDLDKYMRKRAASRKVTTGFDKYFDQRMKDPEFASAYVKERELIDCTDAFVRAVEQARELEGLSKAELARQIDARPEVVRRLLTATDSNPTLASVLKLSNALGFHLELVPNDSTEARPAQA